MEDEKQTPTPVEETEAMKALKEAYDERIKALEQTIKDKDAEHAKQIKEILKSGTQDNAPVKSEPEEEDKTDEQKAVDRILEKIRKQRGI